jgi:site-specific recombinase XerD
MSALLGPGWTAHSLRHRFATRAYAGERDLLTVQQLLGHSSVATTQRYTQIPDDALRRAVMAVA